MDKLFNVKLKKKRNGIFKDVRKEVNKFDESFNLDLKNPNVWAMPVLYNEMYNQSADKFLLALICCVNGLNPTDWLKLNNTKLYGHNDKMDYATPGEASKLRWSDKKTTYDMNSFIFKCRFMSIMLTDLNGKLDKITKRHVGKKKKYEERILFITDAMNDIFKFTKASIYDKPSNNDLLRFMYVNSLAHMKEKEAKGFYSTFKILTGNIDEFIKADFMHGRAHAGDDDTIIYELMKLTYMLCTFNTNFDILPPFDAIEGGSIQYDMRRLVQALGIQIIRQSDCMYSPLFRAFSEARPKILSWYADELNKDGALRVGVFALKFVGWFIGNPKLQKFIEYMLKPGR